MNEGMGTSELYNGLAVALSALALVLALIYVIRVARAYRVYRDERAAVSVGKAVGLMVIALGSLVSASGLIFDMANLAIAGMSIARGAMIVLIATLVLADVRPGHDRT